MCDMYFMCTAECNKTAICLYCGRHCVFLKMLSIYLISQFCDYKVYIIAIKKDKQSFARDSKVSSGTFTGHGLTQSNSRIVGWLNEKTKLKIEVNLSI